MKIGKAHSDVVQCRKGVKQGCPLSPILFDLAMEQLVSGLETGKSFGYAAEERVAVLAYTDDLCLLTDSSEQLQMMLDRTKEFADWAGLKLCLTKCATLMIYNCAARHFCGEDHIPHGEW